MIPFPLSRFFLSLPHSSPPIPQTLMTNLWAPGFVLFCSRNSAYTTEGSRLENMSHLKTHTRTHKNLSHLIPYGLSSFFSHCLEHQSLS